MNDVIEKLAELLKKCPDIIRAWDCEYEDAAADLIANGVRLEEKQATSDGASEWISVKDRLPEYDQIVLCYKADRGVRVGKHLNATYADGVSAFMDCIWNYAFGATHWMPLPMPPREDTKCE